MATYSSLSIGKRKLILAWNPWNIPVLIAQGKIIVVLIGAFIYLSSALRQLWKPNNACLLAMYASAFNPGKIDITEAIFTRCPFPYSSMIGTIHFEMKTGAK